MKSNEQTFLMVWDYILDNDDLDVGDVILLSKIMSLDETKDGCYITNGALGKLVRITGDSVSRRLKILEKKGYINMTYIANPKNPNLTKRFIKPTYENGMSLKSKRGVTNDDTPLSSTTIPLVASDDPPLSSTTIPPVINDDPSPAPATINNINLEDYLKNHLNTSTSISLEHITKQYNYNLIMDSIDKLKISNNVKDALRIMCEQTGSITKIQKNLIEDNLSLIVKVPVLEQLLKQNNIHIYE